MRFKLLLKIVCCLVFVFSSQLQAQRLIDGIDLKNNVYSSGYYLPKISKSLEKYIYSCKEKCNFNQIYFEDLKIRDLLDAKYRQDLFKFIAAFEQKNDNYEMRYFLKMLLVVRIEQLKDSDAFYVLTQEFKNDLALHQKMYDEIAEDGQNVYYKMSAYRIWLNGGIIEIFADDPLFFMQQSYKYQDASLLAALDEYYPFITEFSLEKSDKTAKLKKNQMYVSAIPSDNYKKIREQQLFIKSFPDLKIEKIQFDYLSYSNNIYEISDFWQKEVINKLSKEEKSFYDKNIYPIFSKYIIHNYYVSSNDGFANLRQQPNANSKILTTIPTGTYVYFVEEAGNWVKVYYPPIIVHPDPETAMGYIYKTELEQR